MTAFPLVFQNTAFDVIDQNGQAWLKASELAEALGYARPDALNKIFDRYSDEFNSTMTQNVNLTLSNKNNELQTANVRIFSLRGAHLIAMFSRTAIAKQFRKWVLDILDRETAINPRATINPEQKSALQAIVEQRGQGQRKIFAEMWSRHNRHFNINSYHELLAVRFHEACDYLKTMEIRQKIAPVAPTVVEPTTLSDMGKLISTWMGLYCVNWEKHGQAYADRLMKQVIESTVQAWQVRFS